MFIHDPVYAVVRHIWRVGGSGHIGHDIMFPWHVTCWWHLAHRTWSHVIGMCIICVSFYDIMFCPVQCFSTLVQPFITHSVISKTYAFVSLVSAWPHMLVGFGTRDMTWCFVPVQCSSTLVHSLITHSVISQTWSLCHWCQHYHTGW